MARRVDAVRVTYCILRYSGCRLGWIGVDGSCPGGDAGAGVGGVRGVRIGGGVGAQWDSETRSYNWEDIEVSEIRFG